MTWAQALDWFMAREHLFWTAVAATSIGWVVGIYYVQREVKRLTDEGRTQRALERADTVVAGMLDSHPDMTFLQKATEAMQIFGKSFIAPAGYRMVDPMKKRPPLGDLAGCNVTPPEGGIDETDGLADPRLGVVRNTLKLASKDVQEAVEESVARAAKKVSKGVDLRDWYIKKTPEDLVTPGEVKHLVKKWVGPGLMAFDPLGHKGDKGTVKFDLVGKPKPEWMTKASGLDVKVERIPPFLISSFPTFVGPPLESARPASVGIMQECVDCGVSSVQELCPKCVDRRLIFLGEEQRLKGWEPN